MEEPGDSPEARWPNRQRASSLWGPCRSLPREDPGDPLSNYDVIQRKAQGFCNSSQYLSAPLALA